MWQINLGLKLYITKVLLKTLKVEQDIIIQSNIIIFIK